MYERVFGPSKTSEQIAKDKEKRRLFLERINNHKISSVDIFPSAETKTKHEAFLERNEGRTLPSSEKFGPYFGTDPNAKPRTRKARKARKTRKSLRKRNLRK